MKFIDHAKIIIKSGSGGKGHISFRREKFVPKGGPDGGNGGKGGDVIFKANAQLNTLLDYRYKKHFNAKDGNPGEKYNKAGKSGSDVTIYVPVGTIIKDAEMGDEIIDLTTDGQSYIAAEGGKGGRGNSEFATSTNQAPRYAEPGIPGIEKEIILELKLLADVGIVGLPNAGKSTLISVLSSARPKIADYPFTTLIPNLGIVRIGDYENFAIADIPGLIQGASEGKGLGMQFLRHIERTKVLLILLDCTSTDPKSDYNILLDELKNYKKEIADKIKFVCFNKTDLISDEQKALLSKIKFGRKKLKLMTISAITGEGTVNLKKELFKMLH